MTSSGESLGHNSRTEIRLLQSQRLVGNRGDPRGRQEIVEELPGGLGGRHYLSPDQFGRDEGETARGDGIDERLARPAKLVVKHSTKYGRIGVHRNGPLRSHTPYHTGVSAFGQRENGPDIRGQHTQFTTETQDKYGPELLPAWFSPFRKAHRSQRLAFMGLLWGGTLAPA